MVSFGQGQNMSFGWVFRVNLIQKYRTAYLMPYNNVDRRSVAFRSIFFFYVFIQVNGHYDRSHTTNILYEYRKKKLT